MMRGRQGPDGDDGGGSSSSVGPISGRSGPGHTREPRKVRYCLPLKTVAPPLVYTPQMLAHGLESALTFCGRLNSVLILISYRQHLKLTTRGGNHEVPVGPGPLLK